MSESAKKTGAPPLWGIAAEFDSSEGLLDALRSLHGQRLGRLDAFSPVPVHGTAEALGLRRRHLFAFGVGAAVLGGAAMFFMCSFATVYAYPFAIGGKPLFSWPSFVVPSVSFATLAGGLVTVIAFMVLSRLPRLNHPAFNIPDITRATDDRFFVAIEARDESFDPDRAEAALAALAIRPKRISRVPR